MPEKIPVSELIDKFIDGRLTSFEQQAFLQLFMEKDLDPALEEFLWQCYQQNSTTQIWPEEFLASFSKRLAGKITAPLDSLSVLPGNSDELSERMVSTPEKRMARPRLRWLMAASLIFALASGIYFWLQRKQAPILTTIQKKIPKDIEPGRDGAILTLADGSQVLLDTLSNGVIALQKGADILLNNGQLAYDATGDSATGPTYNTITTPRSRQFNVVLCDGTKVWLNAASSLRYPAVFTGKERRVEVAGEAYFEVAKNKEKPFRVNVDDLVEVEVLGTHFNINAYKDERSIRTTLLNGSVAVTRPASSVSPSIRNDKALLKPGQQAELLKIKNKEVRISIVNGVDTDKVMAWKYGLFNFEEAELEEVMRQLSRWYDIDVEYEGTPPSTQFFGKISRNESLSSVLKALEESNVHFRLEEGRRVVVLP